MYQKIQNIQKEIGKMSKSKTNPFFKSGYFDINMLLEKLQPLLEKEKLVLMQPLCNVDGKPAIATILKDLENTDYMEFITMLPETPDAQKMGSAVTYVRRYAIQSLFALISEDDDGEGAMGRKSKKTPDNFSL